MRPFIRRAAKALVLLDLEGCGREDHGREKVEAELETRLAQAGWKERAAAVVIEPELENWVWSDSPRVDTALGWEGRRPDLRSWLQEQGLLESNESKPGQPKSAVEKALHVVRQPRSSSLYRQLASSVSLERCMDPSFGKLRSTLRTWFGDS